jgi:hypothetical protein
MGEGQLTVKIRRLTRGCVKIALLAVAIVPCFGQSAIQTSSFPSVYLKAVVSIERMNSPSNGLPIGTGVFFQTTNDCIALFTAKHVIKDEQGNILPNLGVRVNLSAQKSYLIPDKLLTPLVGGWFESPTADVACRLMGFGANSEYATVDITSTLDSTNLSAAAPLLILGFPMGMRSESYAVPIVRRGIVAQVAAGTVLIEGFVFPGNSGGPVFYVPTLRTGAGIENPLLNEIRLLGIVSGYVPYVDVAVSPQTKRPRITFHHGGGHDAADHWCGDAFHHVRARAVAP